MRIREPRPIDPEVFIPFDASIAEEMTYKGKSGLRAFKHVRCITPRNIAKSYSSSVDAIERGLRGHIKNDGTHKTMWMRRGVEELDTSFPTLLKEAQLEFPDFEFRQRGREWQARPWDSVASSWRTLIYGASLVESYKLRSSSWVDIEKIVFDEFIGDAGNIEGEAVKWEWVYDTISRNRPVRTLMLANPQLITPGVSNPYFVADKIRVDVQMPEFIRVRPKSTLYWFPPEGRFGNQQVTERQLEVAGTEYGEMSNQGRFTNAYGLAVGKRGSRAVPLCGFLLNKEWYGIWVDGDQIYAERGIPNTEMRKFALSPRDISKGVSLISRTNPLVKDVMSAIREGEMLYEDSALIDELLPIMVR